MQQGGGGGGSSDIDAVVGVPLDRGDQCGHFGVKYMDSVWKLTVWGSGKDGSRKY